MKVEIIDHLVTQSKPIDLVACLQSLGGYNIPRFDRYTGDAGDYINKWISSVERIGKHDGYDVIVLRRKDGNTNYFIGHWNDGVIPAAKE